MKSSLIDLVNAIADSDVTFEEHEIKRDVEEPLTFIDNVSDKTNIDIVVSETKGGHEARDDPKAGLESVQKIDHVGAGSVGYGDEPPRICPA